jgi:hypothetical protein
MIYISISCGDSNFRGSRDEDLTTRHLRGAMVFETEVGAMTGVMRAILLRR